MTSNEKRIVKVVVVLLQMLKVKVSATTIKMDLIKHEDFPSILSINETLLKYNITNACIRVSDTQIERLETPFIALVDDKIIGPKLMVVSEISQTHVVVKTGRYRTLRYSLSNFKNKWSSRVALLVDSSEAMEESDYLKKFSIERSTNLKTTINQRYLPVVLTAMLITKAITLNSNNLYVQVYFILQVLGVYLSLQMIRYDMLLQSETAQRFCQLGAKMNCNAVLSSKGARIGNTKWSEIGLFYFSVPALLMTATDIRGNGLIAFFSLVNLAALTYIAYKMNLAIKTVEHYRQNIQEKIGARNVVGVALFALLNDIVKPTDTII